MTDGKDIDRPWRALKSKRAMILKAYQCNLSREEMANELNLSLSTINDVLGELNRAGKVVLTDRPRQGRPSSDLNAPKFTKERVAKGLRNGRLMPRDPDGLYDRWTPQEADEFAARCQRIVTAIRVILGNENGVGTGLMEEEWKRRKAEAQSEIARLGGRPTGKSNRGGARGRK